jgi:hypothetical protein
VKRSINAEALRRAMVARAWTNADLAREANIDADTVTRAREPDQPLSVQTESKIAAALGQNPVDAETALGLRELTGDGAAA